MHEWFNFNYKNKNSSFSLKITLQCRKLRLECGLTLVTIYSIFAAYLSTIILLKFPSIIRPDQM